jgi:GNAT superfamily N-acetyltransferase
MTNKIETSDLCLIWSAPTWDSAVTGYPVWQIDGIELREQGGDEGMRLFEQARDRLRVGLVSCRLPHNRIDVSMFLENYGFRFIEMLYQPKIELTSDWRGAESLALLKVKLASKKDLPKIIDLAGRAFVNERFHIDPRLGASLGNQRYRNWVRSIIGHPRQRLYALEDEQGLLSFFVTEQLEDGTCYWHLNAVEPQRQGQGYGRRAWLTMLQQALDRGATRVRTSIAVRNHRVLNLYANLGFRFSSPLMTFHWVRENESD